MVRDEVELSEEHDEVEVIPITPLRRLEKRLERMETSRQTTSMEVFVKEVLDMVRTSQKLVDDVVTANHKLVEEVAKTNSKLGELVDLIKAAAEIEGVSGGEGFKPIADKLDRLIESQESVAASLEEVVKKGSAAKPVSTKVRLPYPPIKR
jgi:hypothetical protein